MKKVCTFLTIAILACTLDQAHAGGKRGGAFEVDVVTGIAYETGKDADAVRHKLDLYLPKGQKDFPVVLYIHGGGWRKGEKEKAEHLGRVFAKNGIGTVCTNYRLTPQVTHPGHIEDIAKAFAWTHKNIGKHGGNNEQIFVSGHSAGGHLAALLAVDERYLKAVGLGLKDVHGAIPISGVYQLTEKQTEVFGDDKAREQASPIVHIKGKRPPFLFLYAAKDIPDCDKLSAAMSEGLKADGNQAAVLLVEDRDHGSIVSKIANEDDPATQAILEFVAKHSNLKLSP